MTKTDYSAAYFNDLVTEYEDLKHQLDNVGGFCKCKGASCSGCESERDDIDGQIQEYDDEASRREKYLDERIVIDAFGGKSLGELLEDTDLMNVWEHFQAEVFKGNIAYTKKHHDDFVNAARSIYQRIYS